MDFQSCPICGFSETELLPQHLLSHSKESLVKVLLHAKPTSSTQTEEVVDGTSSSSPVEIERVSENFSMPRPTTVTLPSDGTMERNKYTEDIKILGNIPSTVTHFDIQISSPITTRSKLTASTSTVTTSLVTATTSVPVYSFAVRDSPQNKKNIFLPSTIAINRNAAHVFERQAGPSSSAYCISKSTIDQEWIRRPLELSSAFIPDTMLVHSLPSSSLPQVPNPTIRLESTVASFSSPCEKLRHSPIDGVTHIDVDLMTDEEIPPRGEISEFEESDTSSFLSEESNVKSLGSLFGDSRRCSPVIELESASPSGRRKKGKATVSASKINSISFSHHYMCNECPDKKKFKSLFELIEHKLEIHQQKIKNSPKSTFSFPSSSTKPLTGFGIITSRPQVGPSREISVAKRGIRKKFHCIYCDYFATAKKNLDIHQAINHSDQPENPSVFECSTCGKTFNARANLMKHLLVHRVKSHVCPTCNRGYTSNFKLIEHMRVHTGDYPFKCTICNKACRTPSILASHIKTAHTSELDKSPKKKLEFYCKLCHRVLRSKRSYISHIQIHNAKPKKCPYCFESFVRHSVWVRHIRSTHDPQYLSDETTECTICNKKMHPNSMRRHMRIHNDQRPYSCRVCGKNYRTHANLLSHSWTHTNMEKPFKCTVCNKSYLFKKYLDNHMLSHKRRTMHYVCNECGVKFTYKVNMKRHMEEHFSEKKHRCTTCGKAFQRRYYLIEHKRIHIGVKPFVCSICGKSSTTKSNHKAHVKIHDARDSGTQEG